MRRPGVESTAVRSAVAVALLAVALVAVGAGLSCAVGGDGQDAARVTPIDVSATTTAPATTDDDPVAPSVPTVPTPDVAADLEPSPPDIEGLLSAVRAELDAALLEYDRALTALVERPGAATDPADPLRTAWDRAVGPSTAFSAEMLASIRQRFEQDRVVIRPGPSGLAYRHHALAFTEPSGGTVSFTWCGHSPGIGHDADTGAVVDDGVAHARGTGLASQVDGRLRIDSLDEFELEVLAPGSPDPCPAEVTASEQRR